MGDIGSPRPERDPAEHPVGTEPARLREALRTGTPPQRLAAIRSATPRPGMEDVLVEALLDPDPTVRVAAVRVLAAQGRRRGMRGLARAATEDPSPIVRAEAVRALGAHLARSERPPPPPAGRPV